MISSMTGFSRTEQRTAWGIFSWELRSLNHRFMEVTVQLPAGFDALEQPCRKLAAKYARRGKLNCTLYHDAASAGGQLPLAIDEEQARRVADALRRIRTLLDAPAPVSPMEILAWPGVCAKAPASEAETGPMLLELLERGLQALAEDRQREGQRLAEGIGGRCKEIADILARLDREAAALAHRRQKRLQERARLLQVEIDRDRLEQELAILLLKQDVVEELDRLRIGLEQLDHLLREDEPTGRHLNFLAQELSREANTIGAKLGLGQDNRDVVTIKVLIEQIREQAQNVE